MVKDTSANIRSFVKKSLNSYYKNFQVKLSNQPSENDINSAIKIVDGSVYICGLGNYKGDNIIDNALTLQDVIKNGGGGGGNGIWKSNLDKNSVYMPTDEASGIYSTGEGYKTIAFGKYSHAEGYNTIAKNDSEHSQGKYNISHENNTIHSIGIGKSSTTRQNAIEIMKDGSIYVIGVGNYDGSTINGASTLQTVINSGGGSITDEKVKQDEGIGDHAFPVLTTPNIIGSGSQTTTTYYQYALKVNPDMASVAEGKYTRAYGYTSHAEGYETQAYASHSHAEGYFTRANELYSHAEGCRTQAYGWASHTEGNVTIAYGYNAHAEGGATLANADNSHAEGFDGEKQIYYDATGRIDEYQIYSSTPILDMYVGDIIICRGGSGDETRKIKNIVNDYDNNIYYLMVDKKLTIDVTQILKLGIGGANGFASHVEGISTIANSSAAHAEGYYTIANSSASHAEGIETYVHGDAAHAEGFKTIVNASYGHAEGMETLAFGKASHAEGIGGFANEAAHTEGTQIIDILNPYECNLSGTARLYDSSNNYYIYNYIYKGVNPEKNDSIMITYDNNVYYHEIKDIYKNLDIRNLRLVNVRNITIVNDHTITTQIRIQNNNLLTIPMYVIGTKMKLGDIRVDPDERIYKYGYINDINLINNSNNIYDLTIVLDSSIFSDFTPNSQLPIYYEFSSSGTTIVSLGGRAATDASLCDTPISGSIFLNDSKLFVISGRSPSYHSNINALPKENDVLYNKETDTYVIVKAVYNNTNTIVFYQDAGDLNNSIFQLVTIGATGVNSHVEGLKCLASGVASHAEGRMTQAYGLGAHAEGCTDDSTEPNVAIGLGAHVEGFSSWAEGNGAHAEGFYSHAFKYGAHAEGYFTDASGACSHTEGAQTTASAWASHAGGDHTIANSSAMTAIGKWNNTSTNSNIKGDYLFVVGNGTQYNNHQSNAFAVTSNGATATHINLSGGDHQQENMGGILSFGDDTHVYITEETDNKLKIYADNGDIELFTGQDILLNVQDPSDYKVIANCPIHATDFVNTSDIRKKDIVSEISLEKCIGLLENAQEIVYTIKDDTFKKQRIGLIAQDVEEFFPEIVLTDNEGFKSIDYTKLSVICLRLIKDLYTKINTK